MKKTIIQYAILAIAGVILGIAMQYFPHLQEQWGQNLVTFMASDLGCWAVIAIFIATYSKTSLHSGGRCFTFMAAMVAGYYAINPESIQWNTYWIVLAILMFPIGMFLYWYMRKFWVLVVFEIGMIFFFILEIETFIRKLTNNQMIVYDDKGVAVFMEETLFSLGNYILLPLASLFIMVFMILKYRKRKKTE